MNYVGALVKILETPKQTFLNSNTLVIKFRAQVPQIRKVRIVELVCWGNLAQSFLNHYKVSDYILVEGYISSRKKSKSKKQNNPFNKVTITVLKVYPFSQN